MNRKISVFQAWRKVPGWAKCNGSKIYVVWLAILFSCSFTPVHSQDNPWFFGIHTRSNNVLTNDVLAIADMFVNVAIASATDGATSTEFSLYNYHYVNLEDNGEKIDFKRNNPYGLKAYDLFNDIEAGLKVGWQGAESPVGIYLYGAYGCNQVSERTPWHQARFRCC